MTEIRERIEKLYSLATKEELEEGKRWYYDTYLWCMDLQNQFGISYHLIAGIVSAFSPMQNWERNKFNVIEFLSCGDCKYLTVPKRKAELLVKKPYLFGDKDRVRDLMGGLKTKHFYMNIVEPFSYLWTTLDQHMFDALLPGKCVTPNRYKKAGEELILYAEELDMIPNQLQSTIWLTIRRLKKEHGKSGKDFLASICNIQMD